jgi:hypothetical protein
VGNFNTHEDADAYLQKLTQDFPFRVFTRSRYLKLSLTNPEYAGKKNLSTGKQYA